jgi:tetratricopeptide (TPR) repeat protein
MKKQISMILLGLLLCSCNPRTTNPTSYDHVESGGNVVEKASASAEDPAEGADALATTSQMSADVVCGTLDDSAAGYYTRGLNLQMIGNFDEAKELYLQAIELDPGYCDAMDNLGVILRQEGDLKGAIEWYRRSIDLAPHNTVARQNLAVAYSHQGKTDFEMEQYELIIEIDPINPEGYYGLAGIYMREGSFEKAVPLYEKAAEYYDVNGSVWARDAYYGLGISLAGMGRCVEAVETLEGIYDEFIYDAWVNYHLGYCYLDARITDPELAELYLVRSAFLGMELPEEVWEFLPRFDFRIEDDLWITYGYFGIIVPDDQGGFFFPTSQVPYREGIEYGWMMLIDTTRGSVRWQEEFELPVPSQTWGTIEGGFTTISADGLTAMTEIQTELVEPVIGNSWLLERGDPLGTHEMRIYVEGEYVTTFEFEVGLSGESS